VVRLYALAEDSTLVSIPVAELAAGPDERRRIALAEGREFRKLPLLPNFVSNEFFFQFDFREPKAQVHYSGLYIDLGGQGVVATVTVPVADRAAGLLGVFGADITFDIDWPGFAAGIEPPMVAAVVGLPPMPEDRWRPWTEIEGALPVAAHPPLSRAVAALADRERREGLFASSWYAQHGSIPGQGAVAALQVAARTWLVVLFPRTAPRFPLLPVSLLLATAVLLVAGFEVHRRRAERAQSKAEQELAEKQNLLNTMQVPLVVVDPNSDAVVFGNEAAGRLGIRSGVRFADLVADEPRARRHYEHMQVEGGAARRAYGLPLTVRRESGETEVRYAVVRSVAVTAPIEALRADERHRLGILFLLEPEADLALYVEDLLRAAEEDERLKLSGLLSHGVDTLARVLAHLLRRGAERPEERHLAAWLAAYLERRVRVTAWLLHHWGAEPPLPPACSIEAEQARETSVALARVFELARADAELRSSLHWDNGVLAAPAAEALSLRLDWPPGYWFPLPVAGGFGLFLGEVLVNAVQHGRPGSRVGLAIALDRGRRELAFEVDNEAEPHPLRLEPYGGRRILERLARLFGWEGLAFEQDGGRFRVSWRVPVSERGEAGKAD
jgi:hypothetical protein